jgi:hypothetical protein
VKVAGRLVEGGGWATWRTFFGVRRNRQAISTSPAPASASLSILRSIGRSPRSLSILFLPDASYCRGSPAYTPPVRAGTRPIARPIPPRRAGRVIRDRARNMAPIASVTVGPSDTTGAQHAGVPRTSAKGAGQSRLRVANELVECENSITLLTWEFTGRLATPQWALPRLGECVLRLVQRMGFAAELEDATRPRTRRCRTAGQGRGPSFDIPQPETRFGVLTCWFS